MSPRKKGIMKVMKGVRVSPETEKAVQSLAVKEKRSWSNMAELLIELGLDSFKLKD